MAHVCFVAHHRHLLPCSGSSFSTTTSKWRRRSSGCSFFFSGPLRATATSSPPPLSGSNGAPPLNMVETKKGPFIMEIPLDKIRRPLSRTRANDPQKVKDLMLSISEIGLQEPIDVLEVDGVYYGFSGCHRYEAHQRLGLPTIRCKVRKGTRATLRHHLR
ncbi:sulfiredoxin, chloroplastic/mitochondrial [Nymphaea colorata]|nr:sulfiredoxin, chloroplastic/mitochondrial [Nymphaea colorata]